MQSIENRSQFSVAELTRGFVAHERSSWVTYVVPIFGVLLIGLAIWVARQTDSFSMRPAFYLGAGVVFLLRNGFRFFMFRRRMRRHPQVDRDILWTLTDEGIKCGLEDADSFTSWDKIYGHRETKHGFLVYPQRGIFYWLPKSGFENADAIEALRKLLPCHS